MLRLGLPDCSDTGHDQPDPRLGATLHVTGAGHGLLAGLTLATGIYNVCRDGEPVSNRRFRQATGWRLLR